jgi:hypothetical protein
LNEAVEHLSGDIGSVGNGAVCSADIEGRWRSRST